MVYEFFKGRNNAHLFQFDDDWNLVWSAGYSAVSHACLDLLSILEGGNPALEGWGRGRHSKYRDIQDLYDDLVVSGSYSRYLVREESAV